MELLWVICDPDGRYPWKPQGARKFDLNYARQLAIAVDSLGFSGALMATGAHDVWVLSSHLAAITQRMKFLLALHPGLITPTLLAKMSATFDQFSNGRLMINAVNGESHRMKGYGVNVSHDERYALSEEYYEAWKKVISGQWVDIEGKYFNAKDARIDYASVQKPHPPLWFSGSSDVALSLAARQMDAYLTWGEPPELAGEKIATVRRLAAAAGRTLRYGVRLHVIVRETDEEAWDVVERLFATIDPDAIANASRMFSASDSKGQARMRALHKGQRPTRARDLEIHPGMWAGIGLVRPGPGTVLVGSPQTVSRLMREYEAQGFDIFILSGIPALEEIHIVGDLLLPLLANNRQAASTPAFTWGRDSLVASASAS